MQEANKFDPQLEVYKRMQPWQRLQVAAELYWFAKEIIKTRERRENPTLTETELEKKVRSFF